MIVIRVLGPVQVLVNDAPAPRMLMWRHNLALLVYLARSPKRMRTRQHLTTLLWGEKTDHLASHSFNVALDQVRQVVGDGLIESDGDQVCIAATAVAFDTDALDALAAAGDYAGAAALAQGEFMEGFVMPGAPDLEDWLHAEREHWRRRSVDVLVRRAQQLLAAGDAAAASTTVAHARTMDWRPETAVRTAMTSLALAGDRAGAVALFEQFAARLRQDLDVAPDAETVALAEQVRRERVWRFPADARKGAPVPHERRDHLVGRASELSQLVGVWTTCVADRRGAVAVIAGDDGMGKTRLAEELAARARLTGAVVTALRGVEGDRGDPWSGVLGIARGGLLEAAGAGGTPPELFAQLRGTAPLATPGRALSELARAVAEEQPVLVLLDDAHWLSRDSLLAVAAAARDLARAPVLWLITAGNQPPCPELDDLRTRIGRELAGATVSLQPFGAGEMRELGRLALPAYTPEQLDRLTRRLLADTAGIPLLVVALLSAVNAGMPLLEDGKVWPEPTRTLYDTLPGQLPDNSVAAIRVNFRRLSPHARRVLVVAAVLDGRQPAAALGRGSGITGDALAQALDELEWHRWLIADARGYAFTARIFRDVINDDMVVPGERQRIRDAARDAP